MENGIYTGVIIFFHTTRQFTVETSICAATSREDAAMFFEEYARTFASKHKLEFQTHQVLVQIQDEALVSRALYLARAEMFDKASETIDNEREILM